MTEEDTPDLEEVEEGEEPNGPQKYAVIRKAPRGVWHVRITTNFSLWEVKRNVLTEAKALAFAAEQGAILLETPKDVERARAQAGIEASVHTQKAKAKKSAGRNVKAAKAKGALAKTPFQQLRKMCRARGLSAVGGAADLRKRLAPT